jgi:hypothetical protein
MVGASARLECMNEKHSSSLVHVPCIKGGCAAALDPLYGPPAGGGYATDCDAADRKTGAVDPNYSCCTHAR